MKRCCTELEAFYSDMKRVTITVGEGEVAGGVTLNIEPKEYVEVKMNLDDGWNSTANLIFRYCPYCGKGQNKWT